MAANVLEYLTGLYGGLNADEGLLFGENKAAARKIMVCWMADAQAIGFAAAGGFDTIVTHEALFYPYDALTSNKTPDFMSWKVNRERIQPLAEAGIAVIRAHGTVDKLCIANDFACKLGLTVTDDSDGRMVCDGGGLTFGGWQRRVKEVFGMNHVRATRGDPERPVNKIGLPWGGYGLFVNVRHMQALVERGCDLFIAGETDNYGIRFAIESGVDLIETGHEISENPGLKRFAGILAEALPGCAVEFFENKPVFV